MTIIKNWEPAENSQQWIDVVEDSEGPDTLFPLEHGRLFTLWRPLTAQELQPLEDMNMACACELEYNNSLLLRVDQPLIRIVHAYLNTLED